MRDDAARRSAAQIAGVPSLLMRKKIGTDFVVLDCRGLSSIGNTRGASYGSVALRKLDMALSGSPWANLRLPMCAIWIMKYPSSDIIETMDKVVGSQKCTARGLCANSQPGNT